MKSAWTSYSAVILVVFLSVFLFWHVNGERGISVTHSLDADHHDAYMEGAHYHSTDVNGNLHEQIHAKSAKHFPHENTLVLTEPELDLYGPHGETWRISAATGTSAQGSDTVVLRNNVHIEHRQTKASPVVVVTTDKLVVHPSLGTADSDALVTITYPQIVLHGQGLHGDMKAGTLKLLTQIRGKYEPLAQPDQPTPVAAAQHQLRVTR